MKLRMVVSGCLGKYSIFLCGRPFGRRSMRSFWTTMVCLKPILRGDSGTAWKSMPSWYIVAKNDQDSASRLARHASARRNPYELDSSQCRAQPDACSKTSDRGKSVQARAAVA